MMEEHACHAALSAKYPRMPHLPFSPGGTQDDRRLSDAEHLVGLPLVLTEKMDGSNLCLTRDALYARSHKGPPKHASFDLAKARWAGACSRIPEGVSVFSEWLYAAHSIRYAALPDYLMVFGVRDDASERWWSWDQTRDMASRLGAPTVPELGEGVVASARELQALVEKLAAQPSSCGGEREGVVVRAQAASTDFHGSVAKWVRPGHVRTGDEWRHGPLVRNLLRD